MQHSPIIVTDTDGSQRGIMPFARPFINAEQDYLESLQQRIQTVPAVVVKQVVTPTYNHAASHKMSVREVLYCAYVEPVILFVKMNTPAFMQKNLG
jgi:hypothetical protein